MSKKQPKLKFEEEKERHGYTLPSEKVQSGAVGAPKAETETGCRQGSRKGTALAFR